MLDTLQVIFWSVTYVLIIIAGFRSTSVRKVSMPYIPGILNFSWEINALIQSGGLWGHILWLGLDCVIVYFGFRYLNTLKQKLLYLFMIIFSTIALKITFNHSAGMLISSFVIDLTIAICFIASIKQLSPELKIPIAITKLIGDAFAGLYYAPQSEFITIVAVLVLFLNSLYLYYCIKEKFQNNSSKTEAVNAKA